MKQTQKFCVLPTSDFSMFYYIEISKHQPIVFILNYSCLLVLAFKNETWQCYFCKLTWTKGSLEVKRKAVWISQKEHYWKSSWNKLLIGMWKQLKVKLNAIRLFSTLFLNIAYLKRKQLVKDVYFSSGFLSSLKERNNRTWVFEFFFNSCWTGMISWNIYVLFKCCKLNFIGLKFINIFFQVYFNNLFILNTKRYIFIFLRGLFEEIKVLM